jgi:hypothetical protein
VLDGFEDGKGVRRKMTDAGWDSIREFCELEMPIIMFDKDGAFAVATLKEVCTLPGLELANSKRCNANII